MGDVPARSNVWLACLLRLLVLAALCLFARGAIAADEATDQAIELTLDAAALAGGPSLSTAEKAVVKSVMACAIDGSSLEACGRKILVGQLGKLPAPAADLADCLLKGEKVETCGQQAVIKTLMPKELRATANCLAGAAINGGAVGDCVRQAVVDQIPDKNVGEIANCLLQQKPVADCATGALMAQVNANLSPDLGAAATCLIQKQDPSQCTAELASAGGIGKLPPEVTCITNKNPAAIQSCLQQTIIDRLPGDKSQKDLARCMLDPAQAVGCAKDKLAASLPPGVADAANCIANASNPATCAGKVAKGAGLGDALDTLNKMMKTTTLVDPGHAPSSLANLLKVADGIRHENWGEVIEYGGAELYKAAGKIVLRYVLPIPGLSYLADPILDTMVQNRVELVNELLKEARKCNIADPSRCDKAKMGELVAEFYMLMQIEIPCTVLGQMSPVLREVTCGPLGEAIVAVGSTAYDIYKDNDKELAVIAKVLFPGSNIAEAIIALDPDFENAVIGKNGECPANYFSSHVAVCFKDVAFLSMVDPGRAAALTQSVNDACRHDFLACSQRNAAGKALACAGDVVGDVVDDIGGLFSGDAPKAPSCHVDDSDRIDKQCNPSINALKSAADQLRERVIGLANEYAAIDRLPLSEDVCASTDDTVNAFATRCAAALPAKLPGINGGNFSACNAPGRNLPPADLFGAACRSVAMDKIRNQRQRFIETTLHIRPLKDKILGLEINSSSQMGELALAQYCAKQQSCKDYAASAVDGARLNAAKQCGGAGPRWTSDYNEHLQFCLRAPDAQVKAEDQARRDFFPLCNRCQGYAGLAITHAKANITHNCGGTGPRWVNDRNQHMAFCESAPQAAADAERDARNEFLSQCLNPPLPVATIPAPVPAAPTPPPQPQSAATCPGELQWIGTQCKCPQGMTQASNYRCVPAGALPPTPPPPPQPARANCVPPAFVGNDNQCHCPGGTFLQGNRCVLAACDQNQRRGPDGVCFSCSHNDHFDANGRCVACKDGFHVQGDACVPDKAPSTTSNGGTPNKGPCKDSNQRRGPDGVCFSCSHNDHFDANGRCVACKDGFHVQGDACVPDKAPPNTGNGGTNQGKCKDPRQRRGSDGVCFSCSHNDHFDASNHCVPCQDGFHVEGDACVSDKAPAQRVKCDRPFLGFKPNCQCPLGELGKPPTCCPPGQPFKNGQCVEPTAQPACPPNRPVGTPPNCCPRGREAKGGICVSACPQGYKVLDTANKYGSFCEAPAQCDTAMGEVLYPDGNCACPVGTGRYGPNHSCAPPPADPAPVGPSPKRLCPKGTAGVYPNCKALPKAGTPCANSGSYDAAGNCVGQVK